MEYLYFIFSAFITFLIRIASFKKDNGDILVIRLDHLGDLVCTLTAIRNLKEVNPDRNIDILTGGWNSSLLQNSKIISNVYYYNSPVFTRDAKKVHSVKHLVELYKILKRNSYTKVIAFRDDYYTSIMTLLLLPAKRLDRGTFRIKLKMDAFTGRLLKKNTPVIHEIETNYLLANLDTRGAKDSSEIFFFSDEEKEKLNLVIKECGLSKGNYAVLHPGASWEFKRWNPEKFRATAEYLYKYLGLKSVILGSADEMHIADKIQNGSADYIINKVGKAPLRESIFLILNSKIAVCNDSSLMHIASQSGIPTIGLMGPAEIEKFSPSGKNVIFYHHKVECYPCRMVNCVRPDNPCIDLIKTDEVIEGINKILASDK